jgi:hypothetical protein
MDGTFKPAVHPGSWTTRIMAPSKSRRLCPPSLSSSLSLGNHNVFHVSLLEPYKADNLRGHVDPSKVLREADDIEQSEEYDVEEVMGSTKKGRRILYLVKWLDYPDRKDWTKEPFDNFSPGGLDKLREFHQRNPDAPRNYRLTA